MSPGDTLYLHTARSHSGQDNYGDTNGARKDGAPPGERAETLEALRPRNHGAGLGLCFITLIRKL